MSKKDFIPLILGTDTNAYGMAKAFHEAYGVKSIVLGKGILFPTYRSSILTLKIDKKLGHDFVNTLIEHGKSLKETYNKIVLVASSDGYVEQIIKNKEVLKPYFELPFVDESLMVQLNTKESFYETCEKYGLDYPKTHIISGKFNKIDDMPFKLPVVIKPSDSMKYFEVQFEGKKKAYIINEKSELDKVLLDIRNAGYNEDLIMQSYVPGDDTAMRVLNCYSDQNGKVRLMSLGQPLLEDCTPELIGNYTAIIDAYDETLFKQYKEFLEAISYVGFSNFDMKYDSTDGKYKIFEINLRQGRSSYFAIGSGYNIAKFLVDDVVYNKPHELVYGKADHIWLGMMPKTVLKYIQNPELKKKAKELIKAKKTSYTLYYDKDKDVKRNINVFRYYRGYANKYKTHFVEKL